MSILFAGQNRAPTAPLAPWAPLGPLGAPWNPMGAPWGPHGAPWGPMGSHGAPMGAHGRPMGPKSARSCTAQFRKKSQKFAFSDLGGPKWVKKKLRLRGWDPPDEIRAQILRILAVSMSQMVARRPIWWQKGWFWGPLGFRAQPAHPAGGQPAPGGRANSELLVSLPSPHTHTSKIAIPRCGG